MVSYMKYRNKISIFEANFFFLILGIFLLTIGAFVQDREIYSGLLITEYVLILLPSLLFLKIKGANIKNTLRLNQISFRQIMLSIGITIFTYPLAVFFQGIFILILNLFKEMTPTTVPMPEDGIQYLISFFIIAITPGICEEVMFRGVMMNAYREKGYKKSIVISAILFGIFHFNLLNLIGPTILGVIFGIMVYKTNSIYSSIIGHTVNNGIALTLGFLISKFQYQIDDLAMESTMVVPDSTSVAIGSILPFLFLIFCFMMVKTMINRLEPNDREQDRFSWNTAEDIEFHMDDSYTTSYIARGLDHIKYLPVIIVILIFILIHWLYLFL